MSGPDQPPAAPALAAWLALAPEALLRECDQSPFQGPGPGGQKRNRVYSGVRLRHAPSGLSAEASERREARRNLEDALHRLRLALALALPPSGAAADPEPGASPAAPPGAPAPWTPRPPSTKPAEYRILEDTLAAALAAFPAFRPGANPAHADFPRFAFAALLALDRGGGRPAEAAAALGCTASALTRFLAADKRVWARAQEIRARRGLHPLKRG